MLTHARAYAIYIHMRNQGRVCPGQFYRASASSSSSFTGCAITGSGTVHFSSMPFPSLSLCLFYPAAVSKRAMKVHRKRKMDVFWWDMTRRHEYLSWPLSNATSRRLELVSTTKLRCTGCNRSCAHSLNNAVIGHRIQKNDARIVPRHE